MDGASTDETVTVLQRYDDPRLQWISEPDNGQTHAINKGMRLAKGDLVAYLNSDDIYLPGTLSLVAEFFQSHPDVDAIHGNCMSIDENGNDMGTPLIGNSYTLRSAFTKRWHVAQPATFWRREVTEQIGLFDESFHFVMDYDYWLRMVIAGFIPQYINRDLAGFRFHQDSKSVSLKVLGRFWEDWQVILKKIYATPDLPDEIARLKDHSYAYIEFYGADELWKQGHRREARPFLNRILRGNGPARLKVLATTMMIDSYLRTPLSNALNSLYQLSK